MAGETTTPGASPAPGTAADTSPPPDVSAAAAALAGRKAEVEAARDDDAPVRMVDLHDVRAELLGEVAKLGRRAEHVPHAVPPTTHAPAQRPSAFRWVALVAVLLLVVGGVLAAARKGAKP